MVIPGIILAIIFSLSLPIIMIEDTGALESLSRSRCLVGNGWLKTFGLLLLLYIVIGVASFIAGLLSSPFGLGGGLVSGIITAFIQPIMPIGLTLYYYASIARTTQKGPPQSRQTV